MQYDLTPVYMLSYRALSICRGNMAAEDAGC